jgi:hypothetical protein
VRYDDDVKRRLARLVMFLLLGAIVNVAVAWTIAIAEPASTAQRPMPREQAAALSKRYLMVEWPAGFRSSSAWHQYDLVQIGNNNLNVAKASTGWPCLSLYSVYVTDGNGFRSLGGTWQAAGELNWWLPCWVHWPGFAINTAVYGVILWLLYAVPLALRRRRRIKHGLCPACAYPVGDSEVCTECGQPHPHTVTP